MKVFIAEKPSMARELAKCLPDPKKRENGYIRTGGGIVTWAYGHVLQQAEPDAYNESYKTWRTEDLPIIPETWKLIVSPSAKDQFEIIKRIESHFLGSAVLFLTVFSSKGSRFSD